MIEFLKKLLGESNQNEVWITVDSASGFWNPTHVISSGNNDYPKKLCFYNILYSEQQDKYILETEGHRAKEHFLYGEMLQRLSYYNTGNIEMLQENIYEEELVSNEKEVVICKVSIAVEAKKIFKYCLKDKYLVEAISIVKENLEKKGVEVYEQKYNIIATTKGYYAAFLKSDLDDPNNEFVKLGITKM